MNPLSLLLAFVSFVVSEAPEIAEAVRSLLKAFGQKKGIPEEELLPALEDDLHEKRESIDSEVDRLIAEQFPKA